MDHVIFEFHGDAMSDFIESRLRFLAIEMLFQLCRLQKLTSAQLREFPSLDVKYLGANAASTFQHQNILGVFSDAFIDDLFDLVENSRSNDILGYSVIRFLVCYSQEAIV